MQIETYQYGSAIAFKDYETNATAAIKASPGVVYSIYCENLNGAVRYIGIYNKTTAAATNDVPIVSYRVPAGGATMVGTDMLSIMGLTCSTGITFGISTDPTKYAAATATDHNTVILYK